MTRRSSQAGWTEEEVSSTRFSVSCTFVMCIVIMVEAGNSNRLWLFSTF